MLEIIDAIMAVGIFWMIKNANRMALIAIAVAVSILLDILLTLAGPLFGGLTGQNDLSNYWISFWSGLAYSAWVATLLTIAGGTMVWLVQDAISTRWPRVREHEQMVYAAIGLANAIYAEFPVPPVVLTNSPEISKRYQDSHQQAVTRVTETILADQAMDCFPPAARRIYSRLAQAPPIAFRADSPITADLGFYKMLLEFSEAYKQTANIAGTLDYRLRYHVRRLNKSVGDSYRDEADRCFFLGSILEFKQEMLLNALAPSDKDEQTGLVERYRRLRALAPLDELVQPFVNSMRNVQALLERLQSTKRTIPYGHGDFIPTGSPWAVGPE
jgi:hypothetical protein